MTAWRNMTIAERKQFKYEARTARRKFEAAARAPNQCTTHTVRRSKGTRSMRRIVPAATRPHVEDHCGEREKDRRKRQIERGQLKAENGLGK